MKRMQLFYNVVLFGLAASVTAGTLYISVGAASQQETDFTAGDNNLPVVPTDRTTVEAAPVNGSFPLDPTSIRADRSHDIILDAAGTFSGHLVVAGQNIRTSAGRFTVGILQNGAVAGETQTDDEGQFSFSGVKPGPGGLFAFNDNAFLLFGIRLIPEDVEYPANEAQEFDVVSAVVLDSDANLASQIISPSLSRSDLRFSTQANLQDASFPFGTGTPATSLMSHRVQLSADGNLHGIANCIDPRTGRLREIEDVIVYFVREGRLMARTRVERSGEFTVSGLSAGIYSVIATGVDGTFAIAVEVAGHDDAQIAAMGSSSEYKTTALASTLELSAALVPSVDFNALNAAGLMDGLLHISDECFPCDDVPCQGPCCGGAAGGPFAGGGGFGGGAGGAGGGGLGGGAGGSGLGMLLGGAIGGGIGFLLGDGGGSGGGDNTPASPGQ